MTSVEIPIIDVSPLRSGANARAAGIAIGEACRRDGFFYVSGHGIDERLQGRLLDVARRFFAAPLEQKMAIRMELGGRTWRGFFPVGGELTSGLSDAKEGLYLGSELPPNDPRVLRGLPLHGANQFPDFIPEIRPVVAEYLRQLTELGHLVMTGIALALRLEPSWFRDRWMRDPTLLFRMFHYPPPDATIGEWGVGEHTDYGVLTLLLQDDVGGLQIKSRGSWIEAPPVPNTFVCNIGDMLDRMTGGQFRSTPHRVRNSSGRDRYSFPFFFDPGFDADVRRLPHVAVIGEDRPDRWDRASVHEFEGTYGDYLIRKVSKVFPQLGQRVL